MVWQGGTGDRSRYADFSGTVLKPGPKAEVFALDWISGATSNVPSRCTPRLVRSESTIHFQWCNVPMRNREFLANVGRKLWKLIQCSVPLEIYRKPKLFPVP